MPDAARTMLVTLPVLIHAACGPGAVPAAAYADCYNSTCCMNGNFDCKRSKLHTHFAQCRPQAPAGGCLREDGWDCPGWENCAENFQPCLSSQCCKDPGFGCFRRPTAQYAQCLPLSQGVASCKDTDEWLCPGWELCSATWQQCTNTHCCQDHRDVCYEKRKFYAQCLRRDSCKAGVDGTCMELHSQLGQCSAAYQDCHLTGCCQRGEDHCFLKNDGYGKCQPNCQPGPEWSCKVRELPSETSKLTCDSLRSRTNIFKRVCATQYESAAKCNSAYMSSSNEYQPCVWKQTTKTCETNGQTLACDCQLFRRGCPAPVHKATATDASKTSAADEDTLSAGETFIVALAFLIIFSGGAYFVWFLRKGASTIDDGPATADELDADDVGPADRASSRKKKGGKRYGAAELENADDADL